MRGFAPALALAAVLLLPAPCPAEGGAWWAEDKRVVSYWAGGLETGAEASVYVDLLRAQGGRAVATTVLLYCGDTIEPNGSFHAGPAADESPCGQMRAGLDTMAVLAERVVGAPSIGAMRAAFANPEPSIAAMRKLVSAHGYAGISWDIEPKNTTWEDAMAFGRYNAQLRAALNPIGARVTAYSNAYDKVISDIPDWIHSVDRVLGGETYNGQSFPEWLGNYHVLVNARLNRSRVAPAMLTATERGGWNCEAASMQQRLKQLEADGVPELALFTLGVYNKTGGCIVPWFPLARSFLAGGRPRGSSGV